VHSLLSKIEMITQVYFFRLVFVCHNQGNMSSCSKVSRYSKVSSGIEVTQVSPPLSQVSTPLYFKGADHILSN
jgi:hypothetical protein